MLTCLLGLKELGFNAVSACAFGQYITIHLPPVVLTLHSDQAIHILYEYPAYLHEQIIRAKGTGTFSCT